MRLHPSTIMASAMLCLMASCSEPVQTVLVPTPQQVRFTGGYFVADSAAFAEQLPADRISQELDSAAVDLKAEGYRLTVERDQIRITATDSAGLFYAQQTLRQLITAKGVPCAEITDNPRFGYRGIHLDVSRHFFAKEEVFKLLDEMARYKLNTFHLHLTDNGGWRIQIDKYPRLTQLGAYRPEIDWLKWWDFGDRRYLPEGTPGAYGGYYTKDEIRQIVRYAAARYIDVIPEIEFPAHSDEVFVGYPELCCEGRAYTSGEFCVGNPRTLEFMEDVLTEIMELFPSKYVHIGGDEARKVAWKSCPKCQVLAKELGGLDEVQCYLIEHAEKFLSDHNRVMIGWDEILKNNLRPTSIAISYRGQKGAIEAANRGYRAIMSPGEILYFDWYQANPHTQPRAMSGYSPIKKMYSFEPIPDTAERSAANESLVKGEYVSPDSVEYIHAKSTDRILGVQGCMWTEFVDTPEHLEYMIFPRLLAIAEIGWTPQGSRDWPDFRRRVNAQLPLLKARGIRPFELSNQVEIEAQIIKEGKRARVTLDSEKFPAEVRYTLDGSDPVAASALYKNPFEVKAGTTVKAALFAEGKVVGELAELYVDARHEVKNYYAYLETPEVYASTNR